MERSEFKERLKQYKEAKGFDPQLKYWEWKQKYDSAPQPDNMPSQPQPDQPTVVSQPLDDRAHRWGNEHYVDPVNTVFDADRHRSWKEPAQKTFGNRVKFTYRDFMKPADVKYMKFLQSIGRLGNTLKGASIFGEVVQNLFPSEEAELVEEMRAKMDKQNKWLTGQEDIPKYDEGTNNVTPNDDVRTIGDVKLNLFSGIFSPLNQYVDEYATKKAKEIFGDLSISEIRKRMYNNMRPYGYNKPIRRLTTAVKNNEKENIQAGQDNERDDIFAEYLQIPHNERHESHGFAKVVDSQYQPTIGSTNMKYKTLSSFLSPHSEDVEQLITRAHYNRDGHMEFEYLPFGVNKTTTALRKYFGEHTIGRQVDPNRGEYISVYDLWDIAPIFDGQDQTQGIGKPVPFYDRIYLDDYYDVNSAPNKGDYYGGYLPEFKVKPKKYAEGTHRVTAGESLSSIAKKYKLNLQDLIDYNPQIKNPNIIGIGQEINIRDKSLQPTTEWVDYRELRQKERDIADSTTTVNYSVKSGDSLSKIAKDNGLTLKQLLMQNPQITDPNKISIGQNLSITTTKDGNIAAIQSVSHRGNYVVIDKVNKKLTVYNKDNKPIYVTDNIATGASGDDYNTITYVDANGVIRNMQGNNSTPAGITEITGKGVYHGAKSFTRGRYNRQTGNFDDDIASSFHTGRIDIGSNGCVRLPKKELDDLNNLIRRGTKVYTLPEQEGSRFVKKDNKLSFVADNPYGENTGKTKYWDDYNTYVDTTYNPLAITYAGDYDGLSDEYINNSTAFANALSSNKQALQKELGLDSATYNDLAELALGIAQQESNFGTSVRKKIKDAIPDEILDSVKKITRGKSSARSVGMTQIKMSADNDWMQQFYKKHNITPDNIQDSAELSAIATIGRLAHMYNNEVRGRTFIGENGINIDPIDAVLYKYMGKNKELTGKTATPEKNIYIQNVKKYANDWDLLSQTESFAEGGEVTGPPTYDDWYMNMTTPKLNAFDDAYLHVNINDAAADLHNIAMTLPGYANKWNEYQRSRPKEDPSIDAFVNDLWANENPNNVGYRNGKYYPHKSPEGGKMTIGPGFKLGSGQHKITEKQAKRGITKSRLNQEARRVAKGYFRDVDAAINSGQTTNPADTISPQIKAGLADILHQTGSLKKWPKLINAIREGDLEKIQNEAIVTWRDNNGVLHEDKRRNELRNKKNWHYAEGGEVNNPYSAGRLVDELYKGAIKEEFKGAPWHKYDFTISNEEADKLGYFPDARGHRDDRVKKKAHPSHPSRGNWKSFYQYDLTDFGMNNPNHTLFGLVDGGQDPQAVLTYKGGIVLPELTVTPKKKYVHNTYDNIHLIY